MEREEGGMVILCSFNESGEKPECSSGTKEQGN